MVHYNDRVGSLEDLVCEGMFLGDYSNSKMMNVLFTVGLNDLLKEGNLHHVKTVSLYPGAVETGFVRDNMKFTSFK